jgi:predicted regulator of Ras-like GTPase activity (Roadblock/LC7/MglB family)
MALYGTLQEMSLTDLIQHNCQDRKTAQLTIEHEGKKMDIFFKDGEVVHAVMGPISGEDALTRALGWADGKFILEIGKETPMVTIKRNWSSIILEHSHPSDGGKTGSGPVLSDEERRERMLNETLINFLTSSNVFVGAVITDTAGKIRALCLADPEDQDTYGKLAASVYSYNTRGLKMLNLGSFAYTIIQSENNCLVISQIVPNTLIAAISSTPDIPAMVIEFNQVCSDIKPLL